MPLSFLGALDQNQKVFAAGIAGSAVPLAIAAPAVFDVYTCPLQAFSYASDGILPFVAASIYSGICAGICSAITGLFVLGLVPLRESTVQSMLHSNALLTAQDKVHLFGSAVLFWGSFSAYTSTLCALCLTASEGTALPVSLMFGLKSLPPVIGRVAYCVLGRFSRDDDVMDDEHHQQVLGQGRLQWSLVISILAFMLTLGVDVAMTAPSSSEIQNLGTEDNHFAWVAVTTVFVLFLGTVASACWSLATSHAREPAMDLNRPLLLPV